MYQQLFDQTNANVYFTFLLNCYLELKQYSDAEKLIKKQIKKNNTELRYQVSLAKVYELSGQKEKAKQTLSKTLDKLPADQQQIQSFASELEQEHNFETAELVYQKGQKLLGKAYGFHLELANLYQITRNYAKMSDEYIMLLEENPEYLSSIENRLQTLFQNDLENSLGNTLKNRLLLKIQSNSRSTDLIELLIWIFIQEKDFQQALVQAKALDRRTDNSAEVIMNIGNIALSNNDYDAAISSFQFLKDKGTTTSYFYSAECNYLLSFNRKILNNPNHTKAEELELETQIKNALHQNGITSQTVSLLIDLAKLQTHYLTKSEDAITLLEAALLNNNLSLDNKSDIRMTLADSYLFSGNVWDANLVYAKVETDRPGTAISNEAKFNRAKIAYYVGDFKWTSALLDILKAATSKETANDAFELSLLISDNTQDDSLGFAMQMFARADYLLVQEKDSLAFKTYDSIPKLYPGNQLEDDILYRKAGIYESKNMIDSAISYYQQIVNRFSYDIYGDNATFKLGILYETKKNDKVKAMDYYKKIMSDFGNSLFVFDARVRYRILRGE